MDCRQGGVALITALVLLVVITILSLAAIRSGTQELRMAANQEARTDAFQTAVAVIDGIIETPGNLAVAGGAGSLVTVTLPNVAPFSDPLVETHPSVVLQNPDGSPPRNIGTSIDKFGAATFAIDARSDIFSDTTTAKLLRSHARVGQGFMVLVPKSSQSN
jgi:hypothetical protein